jgi:hypothetical protein
MFSAYMFVQQQNPDGPDAAGAIVTDLEIALQMT